MAQTAAFGRRNRLIRCAFALVLACGLFSLLFLRAGSHFWFCLSLSAAVLCALAMLAEPGDMRGVLSRHGAGTGAKTLLIGVLSALSLYGIFAVGNLAARRMFPFGASEIESVYRLGHDAPRWGIVVLLLFVVGPGEEIFWRGYVQRSLSAEFGWAGVLVSVLAYGAVHIAAGNLILILAALVCGAFWALLYELFDSVWINIVSHACWAVIIFVFFPVS